MYLAVLLLLTAGGTRAGKGWRPAIPYLGKHKCPLDHPPLLILSITPGEWNDEGELTSFALKVQQFALGVHYWIDLKLQNDIVVGDRIDHVQELSCRAAFVLQQDKTEAVTISLVIPCATSSAGVLPGHYMVRVDIWGGTRISAECSASGDMWSKTACRLTRALRSWWRFCSQRMRDAPRTQRERQRQFSHIGGPGRRPAERGRESDLE